MISSFDELLIAVKGDFTQLLRVNLNIGPFLMKEKMARIERREELREALRTCGSGNEASKIFVKNYITSLLSEKYKISEENIGLFLMEDAEYKFKLMLEKSIAKYGKLGLEKLIDIYFSEVINRHNKRDIGERELNRAFTKIRNHQVSFPEKMEFLCQKIYENYKGNGIIDTLLPLVIDGISGGVSNNNGSFYVWMMYKGNTISLSFLKFSGEAEIKRICRNLCKSYGIGQLSERRGYVVTELADGSRASISRPPFCESWSFFIRKFRMENILELEDIIIGEGADNIIKLLKYLVIGERLIAITGEQGSGKTTLLASMVKYIPDWLNIRVAEMSFELHLRSRLPGRNIVSFKETDGIGIQEGLDFTKKTDGNVTILGEVATMQAVLFLVQIAQNASSFTLFTHHAKNTEALVHYIRNSLLMQGNFRNERVALMQAVNSVRINIHVKKNSLGKRYIEKISEIVPCENEQGFTEKIIACNIRGEYMLKEELSRETEEAIYERLSESEEMDFIKYIRQWQKVKDGKMFI
ncbi:MAG: ATPase, T2SS/T4P/T4SS family [Catonella sp.]|uniref:ATPase, T2SS/T4P/T4SS family n=1 Tax=Catonella sp. TaxID=2382125 RepID=UPI003F9FC51D